jgi:GNAT superfamily N-acetyltransferase
MVKNELRPDLPQRRGDALLIHRLATTADLDAMYTLMQTSIAELQKPYLSAEQIAASRAIMGLDSQLVTDQTYFVVEIDGQLAGCGGWSRRATLYGSDTTPGRSAALLDPNTDAARIRAMYTHPAHARKGVGRLLLALCERAAASEGFRRAELVATLSGQALYTACGYVAIEHFSDARGGTAVPLVRMSRIIQ